MAMHKCIYCGNVNEPALYGSAWICPICRYPVGEGCCEGKRQAIAQDHSQRVAEQEKKKPVETQP